MNSTDRPGLPGSLTTWAIGAFLLTAHVAAASESTIADGFVFTAGGDMIGPYHPLPGAEDAGFARVASLFQKADLGFANQEGSIFDMAAFPGWPAAENGGGYPRQDPPAAAAMRAMGIALVSKANNHATDWGLEGLVATLGSLKAAGVAQAGAGLSLAEARAPGYLPTPKGVAALVDTASTFPPMAAAGPVVVRRGVTSRPRPGLSPLHIREVRLVTRGQLAAVRQAIGQPPDGRGDVRVGDVIFRAAAEPGASWEMDRRDEDAVLAQIGEARRNARFVVFSIHAHETAGHDEGPGAADYQPLALHLADEAPSPDDPRPAAFEPALFHAAIDAGADVVVRTGPHVLNGIEIYKGKPIFYSLGSLFFDFGGRRSYTSPAGETMTFPDAMFETVVPVSTYRGGQVAEIRLYPMSIDPGGAASGVPHPADAATGLRILERVKSMSAMFGTRIAIEDGVGVIHGPGVVARPAATPR